MGAFVSGTTSGLDRMCLVCGHDWISGCDGECPCLRCRAECHPLEAAELVGDAPSSDGAGLHPDASEKTRKLYLLSPTPLPVSNKPERSGRSSPELILPV